MPSDTTEQRRAVKQVGAPPPEPEHLRCPRFDSTNTKFCYYNNYNFSQPRHFCKACRRYWTHGGTLRDIPVGGGSRKNAKRSRTIPSSSSGATARTFSAHDFRHVPATAPSSFLFPLWSDHGGSVHFPGEMVKPGLNVCGSFPSLLNTQGPGLLALGGFGLGVGPGLEEMGHYGLGRAVWPFPGVAEGGTSGGGGGGVFSGGSWQIGGGDNGFVSGDCFGFPDLAISTHGNVEEEETSVDETEQVNNDEQMPMAADMPDEEQVNNNEQVLVADNLDETEQANNNNNNGGEVIVDVGGDQNQPVRKIALLRTTTPSKREIKWIGGFALLCSLASLILESHNVRVAIVVFEAIFLLLAIVSLLCETFNQEPKYETGEPQFHWHSPLEFIIALLNFVIALCSLMSQGPIKNHSDFSFGSLCFGVSLWIWFNKLFSSRSEA